MVPDPGIIEEQGSTMREWRTRDRDEAEQVTDVLDKLGIEHQVTVIVEYGQVSGDGGTTTIPAVDSPISMSSSTLPSEAERGEESASSDEATEEPAPEPEISPEASEGASEESEQGTKTVSREVTSKWGRQRKYIDYQGQRQAQALAAMASTDGWVTAREAVDILGLPEDIGESGGTHRLLQATFSNIYRRGAVLSNMDYEDPIERQEIPHEYGKAYEYRLRDVYREEIAEWLEQNHPEELAEQEGDDEATDVEEDRGQGISGVVSAGTQQHETLALLSQLCEEGGGKTIGELEEVGGLERSQYSVALAKLKQKNLVEKAKSATVKTGGGKNPTNWRPTAAGEAEIRRIGGYQLNS